MSRRRFRLRGVLMIAHLNLSPGLLQVVSAIAREAGLTIDEVTQRLLAQMMVGRTVPECAAIVTQPSVPFLGVRR
jgi:hypothetical protein